jgi:hypothetical protein
VIRSSILTCTSSIGFTLCAIKPADLGKIIQMKRLLLLSALAALVIFFASCANNSSAATPSSGDDGEGSLAYTIDGTRTVVRRPASSIYINEVSHDAAKGTVKIRVTIFPVGELFNFLVADKGTTRVVNYRPSFEEHKVEAEYMSQAGHNYYADQVSVTISALDAAHVTGTFSGTFENEGKTLSITDGSFDLPMHPKR